MAAEPSAPLLAAPLLNRQIFFFLVSIVFFGHGQEVETGSFPLLMPHVRPLKAETYLCTPIRIDNNKVFYITGFVPNATMQTAHHMLIYGCSRPGSNEAVWNCGEMTAKQPGLEQASPCASGASVIYAWAMDAPPLELPKDVGFPVGGHTETSYLVLQVHYASVEKFRDGSTDDSGVFLHYTNRPQGKTAGVLLMATGGVIPPKSTTHMEVACEIKDDIVIHPFAFRTHTHSLGQAVSGYRVREVHGQDEWTLIGKRDPQLPQMFYPVFNSMTIQPGDIVASRCTMKSNRWRFTTVGPTNEHEMCNFYLMYWVDGKRSLKQKKCVSVGPPLSYWRTYPLRNIPEDASTLE
ncbi:unnamed protein product [Darwinula stevensoni]|uniref:peptidylglycine monooxygenase n=1 Tax=Darwinula stevensoni TaxID=69355 RepID=A0A7R9A7C0_9CRUS|nr:unnamed protein product [Darwinula stevensoni]CAG0892632.1 unnamed protein product [Darwinula stevensoni]